jgi:hypothetical protein
MMGKSDRSHPSACASRSSRCAISLLPLRRRRRRDREERYEGWIARDVRRSRVDDELGMATTSLNLSGPTQWADLLGWSPFGVLLIGWVTYRR